MIRRRDGAWLPLWRQEDGSWVVSVRYRRPDGRMAIGVSRPSRWRLVALWRGLRADVRETGWEWLVR